MWTCPPSIGEDFSAWEWYNNLNGFDIEGNPIIDPTTGDTTVYPFYGDPVSGTGWYEDGPAYNRYMLVSSGSFSLAPGDSQEIEVAIVIAEGADYLDSITKLKQKTAAVREFYFNGEITSVEETTRSGPSTFVLEQNYPNPFNPTTLINYELRIMNEVDLSIYNVLGQKVVTLVSKKQREGTYQVEWDASAFASGVYYYILMAGDFKDVKKMVLIR
jgi:hypothetical protein